MANNQSTNQPGAKTEESRTKEFRDTSGNRPNGEQEMTNDNKTKQGEEDEHDPALLDKSKAELAYERGGSGHSGNSDTRNGSRGQQ